MYTGNKILKSAVKGTRIQWKDAKMGVKLAHNPNCSHSDTASKDCRSLCELELAVKIKRVAQTLKNNLTFKIH